ncbi:unnamed protein product, partial [Dicrocoelium dendriticum]
SHPNIDSVHGVDSAPKQISDPITIAPKKPPVGVDSLLTKLDASSPSSAPAVTKKAADPTETAASKSPPSNTNNANCRAIPKALPNSPKKFKGFRAPAVKVTKPSTPAYSVDHSATKCSVTTVRPENSPISKVHAVDTSEDGAAEPDPLQ